ncbi:UNVERIFIED_CONTAM: hypothetical protein H355_008675 [Colinus virginianus]|nr:hypothetical protein H355_008675 [Colinus virginianus]
MPRDNSSLKAITPILRLHHWRSDTSIHSSSEHSMSVAYPGGFKRLVGGICENGSRLLLWRPFTLCVVAAFAFLNVGTRASYRTPSRLFLYLSVAFLSASTCPAAVSAYVVRHPSRLCPSRVSVSSPQVPLLADVDPYERSKLADALKTKTYNKGDVIIREGDKGDTFYVLLDGEAEAQKDMHCVMKYKRGGYFGELALLKDQPRAATVVATAQPTLVAYLDRKSFKRLLGPVEQILMRNQENYRAAMQALGLDTRYLDTKQ